MMEVDDRDLEKIPGIRKHLVVCLLIGALVCTGLFISHQYIQTLNQQLLLAIKKLTNEKTSIAEHSKAERVSEVYERLQKRRLFDSLSRLEQIDRIHDVINKKLVRKADFILAERKDKQPPELIKEQERLSGQFWRVELKALTIDFELIHEGGLLDFIARLQQKTDYATDVFSCRLARSTNATNDLMAACLIGWLSIETKNNRLK